MFDRANTTPANRTTEIALYIPLLIQLWWHKKKKAPTISAGCTYTREEYKSNREWCGDLIHHRYLPSSSAQNVSFHFFFAAICLLIPCHQKNGIYLKKYIHPEVRFSIRRHSKEENASESTSRCPATLPSILSIVFQTPLSINRERRVCLHMGFTGFLVYWESVGGRKSDCEGSVGVKTNRPCVDYD